jgi:hypothetical protein
MEERPRVRNHFNGFWIQRDESCDLALDLKILGPQIPPINPASGITLFFQEKISAC